MGLDIRTAEFLLHAKSLGVDFSSAATLGHQRVMLQPSEKKRLSAWIGGKTVNGEEYADFFLRSLGATKLSAVDASKYEGADIIHNLNLDLPPELHRRFTCLIDGGTLEHIFDFSKALTSCMEMVEVGGHLIICQMANNCMGHGFYQFSPELFYCALTPENGYQIKFMALSENGVWYEPLPPSNVGERIQARTSDETFIYVVAQRISDVKPFAVAPHQTDYVPNLTVSQSDNSGTGNGASVSRLKVWRKYVGDIKRNYVYSAFPWLGRAEERFSQYRYLRHDRLENKKRFRLIGAELFKRTYLFLLSLPPFAEFTAELAKVI